MEYRRLAENIMPVRTFDSRSYPMAMRRSFQLPFRKTSAPFRALSERRFRPGFSSTSHSLLEISQHAARLPFADYLDSKPMDIRQALE
jgi:hypothetical protein